MQYRRGARVRVTRPHSEYTGCRGTIADAPSDHRPGVAVLGHQVAIDGENGRTRPFLIDELEPLRAVRVRPAAGRGPSAVRRSSEPGGRERD